MTRCILIGKGRRITLEELQGISSPGNHGDYKLEMHVADPDAVVGDGSSFDAAAAIGRFSLSNLSLDDDDDDASSPDQLLSPSATIACLTLLAQTVAQGRVYRVSPSVEGDCAVAISSAIVDLVNRIVQDSSDENETNTPFRLPADATSFAKSTCSLLGSSLCPPPPNCPFAKSTGTASTAKPYLRRLIPLARISLSLARAKSLAAKSVVDVAAALSAERLGLSAGHPAFSSGAFDESRPHRGCVESAAVVRACLQGSARSANDDDDDDGDDDARSGHIREERDDWKYTAMAPQYHGPSRDVIHHACKTVELEMNCSEPNDAESLDDTICVLAASGALHGAERLRIGSSMRVGGDGAPLVPDRLQRDAAALATLLETAVSSLQTALETEARVAIRFVRTELAKKEAALKSKEVEKAKRAAERGDVGGPPGADKEKDKDEFAGMTEAQKAKILKKRAEKEAKAAAKRKAKEAKAAGGEAALTSFFGAGTAAVYQILTASSKDETKQGDSLLSDANVLAELEKTIDALLSGGMQRKPKVPKGTRDYLPEQMNIRDKAFQIIRRVFKRHGAVEIDTPVFELKETLTGKYGEDSKLIYDLADQGGELLALRYDLTVPFARFLAVNAVGNIKRYHIGKVYRRDQPALSRGRYREFYQCDFDIAGVYGRMVPDSECLAVACEILDALPIGDFGIKLNHRRLLDAILDLCGVPAEKFRTICSAVDKLDKEPWEEVRREMVDEKGLPGEVADRIGEFVVLKGKPWDMYNSLMESKKFGNHKGAADAMEDLRILFEYLDAMDKLKFITFDLSLARGLDYYTGVIYEAVCMNGNTQVGSIGGGGRYDNLVSMFQEAGKVTPCVGVSVGIERVFTLMEERLREEQGGSIKQPNVAVLVASAGDNMMQERMKLTKILWDANISAEFSQQENPKLKFEIANALDRDIPFMVIAGEEEAKEGKCKVKDLKARTEETVDTKDLVSTLRSKGAIPVGCEFAMEMLNDGNS